MSEIVVYGPALAPFVDKVVRALRLKKLEHRLVEPQGPDDYRRWSPETGLLPVADLDGQRVADSGRILDVLDVRWPEPPLLSSDAKIADSQRGLEEWASETFFFYWQRYLRRQAEAAAEGDPGRGTPPASRILAHFGILRRPSSDGGGAAAYAAEFAQRIEDVSNFLGTRPYFYSERIGRADLAVFGFLKNVREGIIPGAEDVLSNHANLEEWYDRVVEQTG